MFNPREWPAGILRYWAHWTPRLDRVADQYARTRRSKAARAHRRAHVLYGRRYRVARYRALVKVRARARRHRRGRGRG